MATEIRSLSATITAGTTEASPLTIDLTMPARVVTEVRVRVPPGPNGTMGFALAMAGQHVIPPDGTDWVIADDEVIVWPMTDAPSSGAWQLIGYNTGVYDHTVYLQFSLEPVGYPSAGAGVTLVPITP